LPKEGFLAYLGVFKAMAFDLKDVKQLVELIRRSDLTEFELEQEGIKVRIKRDSANASPVVSGLSMPPFAVQTPVAPAPVSAPVAVAPSVAPVAPVASAPAEAGIVTINSPMVGTFYRSPSPDSAVFVDKGSVVKPDTVVCIIEAMKVMNEIQAELGGTIVEVLVESGATVEFGQPLFKVKKA
jgi:acetyl-CoA carboxylase biotin carboxyl carrier protein